MLAKFTIPVPDITVNTDINPSITLGDSDFDVHNELVCRRSERLAMQQSRDCKQSRIRSSFGACVMTAHELVIRSFCLHLSTCSVTRIDDQGL